MPVLAASPGVRGADGRTDDHGPARHHGHVRSLPCGCERECERRVCALCAGARPVHIRVHDYFPYWPGSRLLSATRRGRGGFVHVYAHGMFVPWTRRREARAQPRAQSQSVTIGGFGGRAVSRGARSVRLSRRLVPPVTCRHTRGWGRWTITHRNLLQRAGRGASGLRPATVCDRPRPRRVCGLYARRREARGRSMASFPAGHRCSAADDLADHESDEHLVLMAGPCWFIHGRHSSSLDNC
jgi:hypothetical protein